MVDQPTETDPQTTPNPAPVLATSNNGQGQNQNNPDDDETPEEKERKRLQGFNNLNPMQQLIMSLLMFFFGKFLSAEDEDKLNGGDPEHDQRYQDINRTFESILGMDDTQYNQFKQDMRQPGADWHKKLDTSHVDFKRAGDFVNNPPKGLLDLISRHESGGDYNVVYGGKHVDLTDMTIDQVLAWQKQYVHNGSASSAAGRYQFLSGTLEGLKKEMHLSGNEKFDAAMQDKLATQLLKRRGLDDFMSGKISESQFMKNLSMEWASLPKDDSGRSYYAGDGLNRALTSPQVVRNLLAEVKTQGSPTLTASATISPDGGINGPGSHKSTFNAASSGTVVASNNTPEKTLKTPAPSAPANA